MDNSSEPSKHRVNPDKSTRIAVLPAGDTYAFIAAAVDCATSIAFSSDDITALNLSPVCDNLAVSGANAADFAPLPRPYVSSGVLPFFFKLTAGCTLHNRIEIESERC